jgi:glycosyltransferase involved in cell wall biosynthesis
MSTISLCMIVKNEEHCLGACLQSVAGITDEIIIVDTGSTDGTKQLARQFEARIFDFGWIDDFSAARNYSFAQGSMEYLMWLDADDVLLPAEVEKFVALKELLHPGIDAVSMIYNTSFDVSENVTGSARRIRLVRRDKSFSWVGVVHEDLIADGPYQLLNSDIVITHTKKVEPGRPSRRNLEIYEKFFASGATVRPSDIFHYARDLELHKEFEKAIPMYLQFLDLPNVEVDLRLFALNRLATSYYMVGNRDKEWECTLKSLEFDVPRPEFSCRIAERFVEKNQFQQAIFWYNIALQYAQEATGDIAIENYPFRTWLPHKQLGLCYYQIGDLSQSLQHNRLAQHYLPNDPDIQSNISFLEQELAAQRVKSTVH